MKVLRRFVGGLRRLIHRRRYDREMDEELKGYLQNAAEELVRRGMTWEDAWRRVRVEIGSTETVKENVRSVGWENLIESFWQDIRFACRQLFKNLGFTTTATVSLALGIGATVSVFSVIYALLLHPYPYPEAGRLAYFEVRDKGGRLDFPSLTIPQLFELKQAHSIEGVAAYNSWPLTMTGRDFPEIARALYMTGDSFKIFGLAPLLGRNFGPEADPFGKDPQPVVVLNYRFWQRKFNGDAGVLGHTLDLGHRPYTIIGVTNPRFTFGDDADLYLPQKLSNDLQAGRLEILVKLRPGVTHMAANAELLPLLKRFAEEEPDKYPAAYKVDLQNLNAWMVRDLGSTLSLLLGAVSLLLAIGCGNVSILLLARGTARQHELAVRSALGASNSRIGRQLLTESLILSLIGTAGGIFLAHQILRVVITWLSRYSNLNGTDILLNLPVLLFSVGLALLTGTLFGLFPAVRLTRPKLNSTMRSSTHRIAGSSQGKRMHSMLVAGQIALTLLLLTAAGASIQAFLRVMHVSLGFDPHHVLLVSLPSGYDGPLTNWQKQVNYFDQLREKIAQMPEVVTAGMISTGTPPHTGWNQRMELKGVSGFEDERTAVDVISPQFFEVLRIPLLSGRLWNPSEVARGATLPIVNQAFVERYFPNGAALGHFVRLPDFKSDPPYMITATGSDNWSQIIGVVADARNDGLGRPVKPAIYMPYSAAVWKGTEMVVRTRTDPLSIVRHIQEQMAAINPDQPVGTAWTKRLTDIIRQQPEWTRGRLISTLFGGFGAVALILAGIGLYSVVSYSVTQRTNEFGIRLALGAKRSDILAIVAASAGVTVGFGLAIGLLFSFGFDQFVTHWIEGAARSPLMTLAASIAIVIVALLACLIPAIRTTSIDPIASLRSE